MTPPKKSKKGRAVAEKEKHNNRLNGLLEEELLREELIQWTKKLLKHLLSLVGKRNTPNHNTGFSETNSIPQSLDQVGPMDQLDELFTRSQFVVAALQIEQSQGRESADWIEHVGNRSESEMNAEYEWLNKLMKDVKTFKDIRDKESGK